uniref:Envelope glycoprotein n=1 Tax=Porcine endogenous retrovirus TaxID=61673 RepID=Q8Q6Y9_9GAMR|nr:envelope glycoprotein [Porcine endogenous retrovirus]
MHPTLSRRHLPIRGGKPKRLKIPLSFASIAWFLTLSITPQVNGKRLVNSPNSHKPLSLTWLLTDSGTGININSTQGEAPLGTWWPELYVCLRSVIPGLNDQATPPDVLRAYGFYVCPGPPNNEEHCGNPRDFFCKQWNCVTSNDGYWKWPTSQQDRVSFSYVNTYTSSGQFNYLTWIRTGSPKCSPSDLDYLKISFTEKGKQENILKWVNGMSWGMVYYGGSGKQPGSILTIRLKINQLEPPMATGPNTVLTGQRPPTQGPGPSSNITSGSDPTESNSTTKMGAKLFSLIQGAFQALNSTTPEATSSCWLCLALGPPYYEGMARRGKFNVTKEHRDQCTWGSQNKLTLTEVFGKGTCIGKVPPSHQHLCNHTEAFNQTSESQYLVPGYDRWWACNTGLTPCVSTLVFNQTKDFCIMVQIVPRVYYYPEKAILDEYDYGNHRQKREPISLTLAVMLGLGVAAGVGTGTAALVTGPQQLETGLSNLHRIVTEDLQALEKSVSNLEESLTSLSEVVLQNRRGLDLLFLKEGGLCVALKEECCFYVDHSGAIRDSMNKLRERLEKRRREKETTQGWFEGWFNRSPWLATLLSALTGPLIVLLLLLTVGPCIINKLIAFIRERISAVQIMVLRQQYQSPSSREAGR